MFFPHLHSKNHLGTLAYAAAILVLLQVWVEQVSAHLELYHNVEVNFTETAENGKVRLYFTIHAPELLVGFEKAGAEIFDAQWLRSRSDEQFETLFERGRKFVAEKFTFKVDDGEAMDLSSKLHFTEPDIIRKKSFVSGVPVGCILVSAEFKLEKGARHVEVTLSENAGKRLLLVCNRKGAFPEVHDMDTGAQVKLKIPVQQGEKK